MSYDHAYHAGLKRYSNIGRPRALTDAQVERVMHWHRNRISISQLADEMGVKVSAVRRCIEVDGRYKTAPPDVRVVELANGRGR